MPGTVTQHRSHFALLGGLALAARDHVVSLVLEK
jgi:hypothetical protein